MTLQRRPNPEEEELEIKKAELSALEEEFAEKELELETLGSAIDAFLRTYFAAVDPKDVELQDLRAKIARAIYALNPTETTRSRSEEAAQSAKEAAGEWEEQTTATGGREVPKPERFKPTDASNDLFIRLVKQAHPDLAEDEGDRLERNEFMARGNRAYREGDEDGLSALVDEWDSGAKRPEDESVGDQLVRLIRLMAAVRRRLGHADSEIAELKGSDSYLLMERADAEVSEGRDLIGGVVAGIEDQIQGLRTKIPDILGNLEEIELEQRHGRS